MPYADVEDLIVAWLHTDLTIPPGSFADELPYNLRYTMPMVIVGRFGGADRTLSLDAATVDVDVFHQTRAAAKVLAEQVRQSLRLRLPGRTVNGAVVAKVRTISGPTRASWDDRQVWRFTAAYELTLHKPL